MPPRSPQAPDSRWAASWGGTNVSDVGYRVAVTQVGGAEIAMELFSAQSDAQAFMDSFLSEGSILDGMPGAYTVTMDELFRGSWVPVARKLVRS